MRDLNIKRMGVRRWRCVFTICYILEASDLFIIVWTWMFLMENLAWTGIVLLHTLLPQSFKFGSDVQAD